MAVIPEVNILHELPGRLRLRLTVPPLDSKKMQDAVIEHEGIEKIQFTPVTRSLLIQFDTAHVTREEIIIRVALYLSLENNSIPVRVNSETDREQMSDWSFYSALLIAAAFLTRAIWKTSPTAVYTRWAAGAATAWAVLDHGIDEVQEDGVFHPEVLSLSYLLIAMIRGNFLPAAAFTWGSAFGRHLLSSSEQGVEVSPIVSGQDDDQIEVTIKPVQSENGKSLLFSLLPAALKYAMTGDAGAIQGDMIEKMRGMAGNHENVLDSLGKYTRGIPIKIN